MTRRGLPLPCAPPTGQGHQGVGGSWPGGARRGSASGPRSRSQRPMAPWRPGWPCVAGDRDGSDACRLWRAVVPVYRRARGHHRVIVLTVPLSRSVLVLPSHWHRDGRCAGGLSDWHTDTAGPGRRPGLGPGGPARRRGRTRPAQARWPTVTASDSH
jgi:hypothetical protein